LDTRLIEIEPGHAVRCFMRDPATKHHWAGVERTDWRFEGDEVFVEATEVEVVTEIDPEVGTGERR
jgi:hypothetical protein